jgi:hypothetical protein
MVKIKSGIILYPTKSGRKYRWHMQFPDNPEFMSRQKQMYLDTGSLCKFLYMVADLKIPKEKAWKKLWHP